MNTVMKGILGGVVAALIILPLQSAQAWDNGSARGGDYHSGSSYYRGYRGHDGPGYYRGYRGYDRSGYSQGYRGDYGRRGYYGRHWHGDRDSTGAVVAGVALGAIIGAAIINSAPPPPVMLPPPPPPW